MSKELSKYSNEPLMYALKYHKEGLAVIPLKFKTKEAAIKWGQYQKERPPAIKFREWFKKSEPKNIAIICGVVSGNLIVMDFDEEDKYYEFLNTIGEDLRNVILGTRTVITNRGRHVYLRVDSDEKTFRELFPSKRSEKWHVDFQSEGKYVVAPPSVHPSGRKYELEGGWIEIKKVSIETMLKIKRILFPEDKIPTEIFEASKNTSLNKSQKKNRLTEADMLEIVNLLAPAYKEGFRNNIVYSLSGWLAKAGISMEDALKVATFLAQKGKDPDYDTPEFRNRLDVVIRSYEKWRCGINVAGKKYLIEFLEGALEDEEQVISIMKRLEELIGVPSRSSGVIFVAENESEGSVYYANFVNKYIAKGQFRDKGGSKKSFLKKGRIIDAVPTKAIRYIDPISGTENLDIVFESNLSPVPLTLQGVERRDILSVLKRNGYIVKNRIAEDALNAILNKMILSGLVETKTEFSKTGVFWYQGEMHYTKIKLPEEIPVDELREALEILDEIVTRWYGTEQEKFVTVLKWSTVAPFAFMQKQKRGWLPWLFLVGAAGTGKSTIALLATSIWGNQVVIEEKSGASAATPARLAKIIEETTFPVIISEPGEMFTRDDTTELIKNSVTSTIARGRYVQGVYVTSKALSPVIFTSNKLLPSDDSLLRRFHVIYFEIQERKTREEAEKFERIKREAMKKLNVIGDVILLLVKNKGDIEFTSNNWQETATELLREIYALCGKEEPKWIDLFVDSRTLIDYEDDLMSRIRMMIIEEVNNAYRMFPDKGAERNNFKYRLIKVIEKEAIPWLKEKNGDIIITREIQEPLRRHVGELSMKSLATLIGGSYGVRRVSKKNAKVVVINLYKLLEFLQVKDELESDELEDELNIDTIVIQKV